MPQTQGKDPKNVNRNYTGEIWTEYEKLGIIKDAIRVPPWRLREAYHIDQLYADPRMDSHIRADYAESLHQIVKTYPEEYPELAEKTGEEILGILESTKEGRLKLTEELKRIKSELHEEDLALPRAAGLKWVSERLISRPEDYALLISGMTKKKKNYYSSWDGKYSLMTMSVYESPFIRFEGPPGGGKTAGMTMLGEEAAWRFGAWLRGNIPIPTKQLFGRTINTKLITDLGDLFLDDPPGSSIFLAPLSGVWVIVMVDEHGMALEGYTKSQISSLYEELFWLRRHLKVLFYSTGVSNLPPGVEQYVTKKIMCQSKNYGEQQQFDAKREFRWKVQKRIDETKYHEEEIVYRIPKAEIEPDWGNPNELAPPMTMGISIKNLLQSIDTRASSEQMAAEADFYVRFWRAADEIEFPEEMKSTEERKAFIRMLYEDGLRQVRKRLGAKPIAKNGKLINSKGYATRAFYECQEKDCGNRWLFTGETQPKCPSCLSRNVKPLGVTQLTAEEYNLLELAYGEKTQE